jgi:hypothetical protein
MLLHCAIVKEDKDKDTLPLTRQHLKTALKTVISVQRQRPVDKDSTKTKTKATKLLRQHVIRQSY